MVQIRYLIYILLLLVACACKNTHADKETEDKALQLIPLLDEPTVQIFKEWNYNDRHGENWEKLAADTVLYTVNYAKIADTTHLFVFRTSYFATEFDCTYPLDHKNYYIFDFAKYNDSSLYIIGAANNGRDTLLEKQLRIDSVFRTKDPFVKFNELTALKNKLGVFAVVYRKANGDFVQFFLSPQVVLTYLPSPEKLSKEWQAEFEKGKTLKPNWNLRVL